MNSSYWSRHFREAFIPQLQLLEHTLLTRVLPAFEGLEAEAELIKEREYERLGALPASDDSSYDMADAAEDAFETSLAHYLDATSARQVVLNLWAASLHHLFEQQLLLFHRREVLSKNEENDPALFRQTVIKARLLALGINLDGLASWAGLEELRLVANTVKHGDGVSAQKLHRLNPSLFLPPILRMAGGSFVRPLAGYRLPVFTPLAGDDVFVNEDDVRRYLEALVAVWEELAGLLASLEAAAPP